MSTIKQQLAVKKLVENRGMAISRAMMSPDVGYDPTTAKNPMNLTNSKGYKEELAKYGLTEELITSSLVEDIKAKPRKRFLELALGSEILGMKKRDNRDVNINIIQGVEINVRK